MSDRCVYEYAAGRCTQPGDYWIGVGESDDGSRVEGWVCEKHLQYTSDTDQGHYLHSRLADARAAQLASLSEGAA